MIKLPPITMSHHKNMEEPLILQQDVENLNNKMPFLTFISGVSIYCDPTASRRREVEHNNIFAIVTREGNFQKENITRFYDEIKINYLGLFNLSYRKTQYDGRISHWNLMRDFEGNEMDYNDFTTFLTILKSRNKRFGPEEYYTMEVDIKNSRFNIIDKNLRWIIKSGERELKLGIRDDGLEYLNYETYGRPDRCYTHHEIKDQNGNQISLNNYYWGFVMLENGKKYLNAMRTYVECRV